MLPVVLRELLAKRRESHGFAFSAAAYIRECGTGCCPLAAAAQEVAPGLYSGRVDYFMAGTVLGIAPEVSMDIAAAADGVCNEYRAELLEACGLLEG